MAVRGAISRLAGFAEWWNLLHRDSDAYLMSSGVLISDILNATSAIDE
jgi:hypothetical protein